MTPSIRALGLLLLSASSAQADPSIGDFTAFEQVGSRRVSRVLTEFTYRAIAENATPAIANVLAVVTSTSPHTTLVDAELDFGSMDTGAVAPSLDTFTFQHDRRYPFDPSVLQYAFTFDVVVTNAPPVADAGPDQTARVGDTVTLDGTASTDPDGDPLSFGWTLVAIPPGSAATLSGPTSALPTFQVDVPGFYEVELVVNDGSISSAPDTVTVSTENSPPVADAGPDQTVFVTDVVTLDGSGSFDADGDVLDFSWSLTSVPFGSGATLSDPTAILPSFEVDVPGTYVAELVVDDGLAASAPDTVTVDTENSAPVADAGPDQTVLVTDTVVLDGSGSSDVDGDPLAYAWSLTTRPAGSTAALSDPAALTPTFEVDLPGSYVARLVVDDGTLASAPDTVRVDTVNSPPVADAGPDRTVFVTDTVVLDGSGSMDVDGDGLSFSWSFTSKPAGSAASLSDPAAVAPSFVADAPGTYALQLVVDDGVLASAPDTVRVDTESSPPVADAGPDQTVLVGETVTLDGSSSSDVDGDALTFSWSLSTRPPGSAATLSDAAAVMPSFVADLPGAYVAQLVVNDGLTDSAPDTVRVDTENSAPVADAGPDQTVFVTDVVTLDGSGSADVDGDLLSFQWSFTSRPAGSNASLSNPGATMPTFVVDAAGTYVVQLIVDDGSVSSAPDTVRVDTENSPPVAEAGPDQAVAVTDPVFLDGSGSSDVDGDPLSFSWSFTSRPAGSLAVLDDPSSVAPSFVADLPGTYVLQLVVDDGTLSSGPDSVLVVTENSPPVASTGPDRTAALGATVTLDGSGSRDVDSDPLTFSWTLVSLPAGSAATLSDPTGETTTFVADLVGDYVAELVVSDGNLSSSPDTVTVTVDPLPGIVPFSRALGAGLQFDGNGALEVGDHGGVTVRVETSDPALALVAPDALTPGSAFVDVFVPDGSDSVPYVVQAVAGVTGTATITASAPGFATGTGTIEVVEAAVSLFGLSSTRPVGASQAFTVLTGIPNTAGTGLGSLQAVSAGNAPQLVLTVTSSDGAVGRLTENGSSGPTVRIELTPGLFQTGLVFEPLSPGTTTISVSVPGFVPVTSSVKVVTVEPPAINAFSRTIGAGLQFASSGSLGISNHGGVTVRVESDNPAVALIAADALTPGTSFIDVFVPDGSTSFPYVVQAVAGATGTVTVTATTPGFAPGLGTIDVVQPAVTLGGLASTRAVGSNDTFTVLTGIANGAGTGLSSLQAVSAANVPQLVLTASSSDGAVGQVSGGGASGPSIQIPLGAGSLQFGLTFEPLAPGTTTVTVSIPGFLTTTAGSRTVEVTP